MRPMGSVQKATELIGQAALNHRGENLGKVTDLIADLPGGRIAEVIIDSGNFMGLSGALSAVPPQVLHLNSDGTFSLATTKDVLAKAPHFPGGTWPLFDRGQIMAVDEAYRVQSYFRPLSADNPANIAGSHDEIQPQTLAQTPSDMAIAAKIREDLRAADELAAVVPHVSITTIKGQVTLRGWVNTVSQKLRAGEIAAQTVPLNQVSNELEVRDATISSAK
jgi:sporulation protein YlmC with PRC-barrel domain